MEKKSMIPRQKFNDPETLGTSPVRGIVASGPASTSLPPPPKGHATHTRSKTLTLQLGRGSEPSPETGTGKNRYLASSKYWTGRGTGGLQSPRLHGFSPREVNAFEQRKSIVESIPEEGDENGEGEDEAKGEGEQSAFDMGERGAKLLTEDLEASDRAITSPTLPVGGAGNPGRLFTTPDGPLPILPGVGILPDRLCPSAESEPDGSDTNQHYTSLNRPSISATGKAALQKHTQGSNILLQQPSVTAVDKELPPSPVYPWPRVSPLLPPPDLQGRSRLVSITPSLVAQLEIEESEGGSFSVEHSKGSNTPKAKLRQASGRRVVDAPILSSFSTDTDTDFTEDEQEDEQGQADYLPIQTVPGQLLSLVEIDGGDPAIGRKGSVKRKPVLGKSKLAQEWATRSSYRGDSGQNSPSYPPPTQDRPRLLDIKRANHKRDAHHPFDQESPGAYPKPLSGAAVYEARSSPLVHMSRSKRAKLLGFGGGTREIGNIEHVKGLERGNSVKLEPEKRSSTSAVIGELDDSGRQEDITSDGNERQYEGEGFLGENARYLTRKFEVDVKDTPTEVPAKEFKQERVDSDTDMETGRRRRNLSQSGQSWLEIETASNPTATNPAANNTGGWRDLEAVDSSIMKGEEATPLVEHIKIPEKSTAVNNTTPRLPIYKPPDEINDTQMHSPILSTLTIPPPPSGPKDITNIAQSHTKASPPLLPQHPQQITPRPRKRYVTLTLNLYRGRNESLRTTRILIPISSTGRGYDDQKIFSKIKKEYIAMTGGAWRIWCGLRGIKWVGINEVRTSAFIIPSKKPKRPKLMLIPGMQHLKPVRHLGSHSASSTPTPSHHIPLDPALTRSARLIKYINNPQTARGQRGYMELLRGSMGGLRPATYSVEIVEDWIPLKVGVVGAAPVVGSVAATATMYNIGYGGENMAFQIGILVAILGWGVVGTLVLLS
ncbi:hypothetical protein L211DRAFT_847139 [Terfezia boudieri ATCC MYA-4762]|uniref:Uncharacterized protein n=1 Tax=Terfezia boudieri ATCC MYA-4762 TaxID=1051890 RepID=A0A3N4LUB2_9PEZI|nr:hypothetical protein L211DRAFT_847139 [Terfezia boudieri ATCC MYA-4762]